MNSCKIFIALIILFLFFSSCLRPVLPPMKEYPYTIIYNGNYYEGELEYLDSLNLLNLNIKAYYIPDSTKNIETHVMLDIENRGEKEIIFDSSSVIIHFNHLTTDLVFIEPNRISIKKDDKCSIDYYFDSKPNNTQTLFDAEEQVFFLTINPVINSKKVEVIKNVTLQRKSH